MRSEIPFTYTFESMTEIMLFLKAMFLQETLITLAERVKNNKNFFKQVKESEVGYIDYSKVFIDRSRKRFINFIKYNLRKNGINSFEENLSTYFDKNIKRYIQGYLFHLIIKEECEE